MREYPYPYPWRDLPGTQDELLFLERRFAEMSVLEQYQMAGAGQLEHIETAADLINLTANLNVFDFYPGAVDEKTLGLFLSRKMEVSPILRSFLNYERLGADHHEEEHGVFIGAGYVEQFGGCLERYRGDNLDQMDETCIRIKLASEECPDGVWMNFPDEKMGNDELHEMEITLSVLKISNWNCATALETRCCFPNLQNLAEQYESVEELIRDADNFGYIYEQADQGERYFYEQWQAAMELEGCTTLARALDISQNLHCFDYVPSEEHWEDYGHRLAQINGIIKKGSELAQYFDAAAYAAAEIERRGLTPCKHGFICRNDNEFICEFSLPKEEQGMNFGQ